MSTKRYEDAVKVAQELVERSDEMLFEELGLRIKDMENIGGYERSQRYTADFAQDAEELLSMEDLKKVGQRWWSKIEKELMKLICDPQNEDMKKITGGKTIPQVAASLATAAIVSSLAPPAWIIVATSIAAAKIAETGLDSLCEVWRESLDADKPK